MRFRISLKFCFVLMFCACAFFAWVRSIHRQFEQDERLLDAAQKEASLVVFRMSTFDEIEKLTNPQSAPEWKLWIPFLPDEYLDGYSVVLCDEEEMSEKVARLLSEVSNIKELVGYNVSIPSTLGKRLHQFQSLRKVRLEASYVKESFLANITSVKQLEELELTKMYVERDALTLLPQLEKLRIFRFSGRLICHKNYVIPDPLQGINEEHDKQTKLAEAKFLSVISQCSSLETLSLKLDWSSDMYSNLVKLKNCTQLENLTLIGVFPQEGLEEKLRKEIPSLKVIELIQSPFH